LEIIIHTKHSQQKHTEGHNETPFIVIDVYRYFPSYFTAAFPRLSV